MKIREKIPDLKIPGPEQQLQETGGKEREKSETSGFGMKDRKNNDTTKRQSDIVM
jgi:hypothetical protein